MAFVRYMSKWMMVSGLFMVMYCGGALMVGTSFVWTPIGWAVSWSWLLVARWGISLGQIFACRMRKTTKKKKKSSVVSRSSSIASTNASSESSRAGSTIGRSSFAGSTLKSSRRSTNSLSNTSHSSSFKHTPSNVVVPTDSKKRSSMYSHDSSRSKHSHDSSTSNV